MVVRGLLQAAGAVQAHVEAQLAPIGLSLPKLMALDIEPFDGVTTGATPPLRIRLNPAVMSEALSAKLKSLLSEHPGDSEVFLHLGETTVVKLPDQFSVSSDGGLVGELRVLLGPDAIVL